MRAGASTPARPFATGEVLPIAAARCRRLNVQRFRLGSFSVARVGFGAIQLPGPGVFGPPRDRDEAIRVLHRAVELGVDHIDTAQFYGPDVANELIREALHPYPGLAIVSKVGARRDERGGWLPAVEPDQLRRDLEENLRALGTDRLAAVNLRVGGAQGGDPNQPGPLSDRELFDAQLAAMIRARDEGLIGGIGLSNITLEHLLLALDRTDIACVQNAFNLIYRSAQSLLDECETRGIAFVPFFPLGSGFAADKPVLNNDVVRAAAARLGHTPAQIALAWTLSMAPNVLLIPGTSSVRHLEENMAAADIELDEDTRRELTAIGETHR
jgi:aryl-alcohol dehydrogenase-like predicted oxidoreductase